MTTSNKTPFGLVVGLAAALQGADAARAEHGVGEGPGRPETLTMSGFIARVREDLTLRARFADGPRAVLLAHGIDPQPFTLPDRLTEAQLARFVSGRSRIAQVNPSDPSQPKPGPPAVVYGPPAAVKKPAKPPEPAPPAPVYGPPAGTKQP